MTHWSTNPNPCFEKERQHCWRHTRYPHSIHSSRRKQAASDHRCHKTAIGHLRGIQNFAMCCNRDGFLAVRYFAHIHSPELSLRLLASVCGSKVRLGHSFSLIRDKFSLWDSFQWRDTGDLQDKGYGFKHQLSRLHYTVMSRFTSIISSKTACKAKIRKNKINLSLYFPH